MFLNHTMCSLTLQIHENVKMLLKDYQGALQDLLDKANGLEPYNVFTLKICGNVKGLLKDY